MADSQTKLAQDHASTQIAEPKYRSSLSLNLTPTPANAQRYTPIAVSDPTEKAAQASPCFSSLGKPRRKKSVTILDILALTISWLCLTAACITVAPRLPIPFRLGLTHQLQIIGFLLSLMNLCLQSVAPRLFVVIEARFGPHVAKLRRNLAQ